MFYIFEMANNHMGSVEHGKHIIDMFGCLAEKHNLNAGIKFQFRQLDTFIHKNYIDSDLKFVKRFRETKLDKKQFGEMMDAIRNYDGFVSVATPFDNESLCWIKDLEIAVVKVASCSIDDWPLLEEICNINKRIVISTAGADVPTLHRVHRMFKKERRDFAFMHCVGEYPTPSEHADLNRINVLKREFPDIEIGFSTHESPQEPSLAPIAYAMGCSIVEKHVGVPTGNIKLNDYSCSPADMERVIVSVRKTHEILTGKSSTEKDTLKGLKRGIYLKSNVYRLVPLSKRNFYYAMPLQEGQADASLADSLVGQVCISDCDKDDPVMLNNFYSSQHEDIVNNIRSRALHVLRESNIHVSPDDDVEISCHYGLDSFFSVGVLIIEKVNREYCKKLLVIFPQQQHPVHRHIRKEETFELLYGDCALTLGDKTIEMESGNPVLIERGVNHSFGSKTGAVVEEVSTKHYIGDSIYADPNINKLDIKERKINITL